MDFTFEFGNRKHRVDYLLYKDVSNFAEISDLIEMDEKWVAIPANCILTLRQLLLASHRALSSMSNTNSFAKDLLKYLSMSTHFLENHIL